MNWKDYKVSVEFKLLESGSVFIAVRSNARYHSDYRWLIQKNGNWKLTAGEKNALATGNAKNLGARWHSAVIQIQDDEIQVHLNGVKLAHENDAKIEAGIMAIGTGWNEAFFDSIHIEPVS